MDDLDGFIAPGLWVGHPTLAKTVTGSTNDDARAEAAAGCAAGTLILADTQTAGRGRRGRIWQSPPGENIYMSLVLRPGGDPSRVAPLPLVVGLAVAEALSDFIDGRCAVVKWPNDVRVDGRKLGGVLVESSIGHGVRSHVAVGIGINVRGAAPPAGMESVATTLRVARNGRDLSRGQVLTAVLRALEARLDQLASEGFDGGLRRAVSARCETLGVRVTAEGATGVAESIGPDGALWIRTDDGATVVVRAGDVLAA